MTARRRLALSSALLLASSAAVAGDCPSHPVTLIELQVVSCARFDAASAGHVVPFDRLMRNNGMKKEAVDAQVAAAVAEHPAVVLEVKTRRSRTIQIDGRDRGPMKPEAEEWKTYEGNRWLVLRTGDADACKRFGPKATAVVAHPTDCSCDTGPHGWCAVDREAIVTEVPAELASFAR
jgi:hypothetical protein